MSYHDHVRRLKTLMQAEAINVVALATLRFEQGDEFLAIRADSHYGDSGVEKAAAEVGIPHQSAINLALTAQRIPERNPAGFHLRALPASWSAFREIATIQDDAERMTLIADLMATEPRGRWWTVDEIRVRLGRKQTNTGKARDTDITQIVREQPEAVARAVAEDRAARLAASKAISDKYLEEGMKEKETSEKAERETLGDETIEKMRDEQLIRSLEAELFKGRRASIESLATIGVIDVGELREGVRDRLLLIAEDVVRRFDSVRLILSGETISDSDIAELLKEGK